MSRETPTAPPDLDAIEALVAEVRRLRAALDAARIPHLYVDDDPWYSCPKHPDYPDYGDKQRDRCYCPADAHNARIDAALGLT